ncbi:MAG: hypothetical protein ACR2PA_19350, partial [Hyphomicrobiaceae bacterium]
MPRNPTTRTAWRLASRRHIVRLLAALPATLLIPTAAFARRTPSATEGPYYPTPAMRFSDADNDLVKIAG